VSGTGPDEIRHLTVEHGDLESVDDKQRLNQLRADHDAPDQNTRSYDTTTWLIGRPDAEDPLADLEAYANRLNPGWWRVRRTGPLTMSLS
jgi:hypothetical protein